MHRACAILYGHLWPARLYNIFSTLWHDMIWYDIYDMMWYMIWCVIWYMIYHIWYDIYDMIWYDMIYDVIWYMIWYMIRYDMIYLLNAIGLKPFGSSTVHIYTQTVHRTTQSTQTIHRTTQFTNKEECGPCPVFASLYPGICLTTEEKARKTLSHKRYDFREKKKSYLTLRRLMSYIYGAPILDVSRSHTSTQHSR